MKILELVRWRVLGNQANNSKIERQRESIDLLEYNKIKEITRLRYEQWRFQELQKYYNGRYLP